MNRSSGAVVTRSSPTGNRSDDDQAVVDDEIAHRLLDLMSDSCCRRVLKLVMDTPRTPAEIANGSEFSLSTVYRKVDALADSGLLDYHLRIDGSGNQPAEYYCVIDELRISIEEGHGVVLRWGRRNR